MKRRDLALFVLLCALWGFGFVALKTALQYSDPIFLASVRFWAPAFVVGAFTVLTGRPLLPKKQDWAGLAWLGVINTGVLAMFMSIGQKRISAGLGAILLYTYPLMAAVVSPIFLGERIDRMKIAGISLGFAGVALLAGTGGGSALGISFVLIGAASWAAGTVIYKKFIPGRDVFMVTAWQLAFGAAFLSVASAVIEGAPQVYLTGALVWSYLYMVFPGMALAGTLWYWLLERGEAAVASAYMFMTPVFGVFFGWLVLDEEVTWLRLAGGALVAVAIYLVNRAVEPVGEADARAPAAA